MVVVRWILFLLLSVAADLVGVAHVGQVEAVEEAEEVVHGPRRWRPASRQAHQPHATTPAQGVERRLASARSLEVRRASDPGATGSTVRKLPPPTRAAASSTDPH
jgi:hypothetical protein